jgi:hypothetical protein
MYLYCIIESFSLTYFFPLSILEQFIDVSAFGSAIAVMDGWSGLPIVNFTRRSGFTVRELEDPVSCKLQYVLFCVNF